MDDVLDPKPLVANGGICVAVSRSFPDRSYLLLSAEYERGEDASIMEGLSALIKDADAVEWERCGEVEWNDRLYQAFAISDDIDRILSRLVDICIKLRLAHRTRMERSLQLEFAL